MDIALSKLMSHVYELEGLLLVADRHGVDTPAVVYDSIRDHARELNEMAQLLKPVSTPLSAPEPQPAPVPDPLPASPDPLPVPELEPMPDPDSDPLPIPEPEPLPDPDPLPVLEPDPLPEPEPEPEPESAPQPDLVGIPDDDDMPPRGEDDELRPAFTFAPSADSITFAEAGDSATEPLRVDEKLQRTMSKDLRKAFSINDRFRFRRELFEGSEAEFVDAINMIEAMHSYDEARDYFLGDLGWDEDAPEVAEFMAIVRNHFA